MKMEDHLSSDIKIKVYQMVKPIKTKCEIDPEELADRQFRETERMMGKYRDTYGRGKGGAIRRK